ncbi:MAG: PilZ domain-containing protein [Thermodesulfovibrionales bacterium]
MAVDKSVNTFYGKSIRLKQLQGCAIFSDENMINQRKHKRVPITGTATLKFERNGEVQSIHAMPSNISLGGIGLYADDPIEDDTGVSITVDFISLEELKTDSIEGCVVYNKNIGDIYFVGIQFNKEISPENQPALYEHIQRSG